MRIALLGGTGDIGEGLALRWAYHTDHEVIVGSRDPDKARAKADEYETELSSRGRDVKVNGFTNEMAADRASVVVLAVPPYHVSDTVEAVSDSLSEGIDGLRALDGGGLANAPEIEGITPLLINVARNNDGLHDLGIRFK